MAENGYAKPVLVTTDWLAEHLSDDSVVVAEVDENPDLYDEGHITGAMKLHWRDDLQWLGFAGVCLASLLGLYMIWKIVKTPGEL